jgi:hypothetical protein
MAAACTAALQGTNGSKGQPLVTQSRNTTRTSLNSLTCQAKSASTWQQQCHKTNSDVNWWLHSTKTACTVVVRYCVQGNDNLLLRATTRQTIHASLYKAYKHIPYSTHGPDTPG